MNPAFDPLLLSRIEDAGLNASAPAEQRWLDGWLVRFSAAKAKRARCVNAVASGRGDIGSRIERCQQIFEEAGLPAIFRITPFSQPDVLDATLAARGMRRFDNTWVMVLSGLASSAGAAAQPLPAAHSIRAVGVEAFAQRVGAFRGSPLALRQAHAERLRHGAVPIRAFEILVGGQPVACAQFAREGDLAGLYDVVTEAEHRGQGHAGRLCRHLLRTAADDGARHAYLQVESDNLAALAVYRKLGFVEVYQYHYRGHPPAD